MAFHQLLLLEGDLFADATCVELLRRTRNALRVVHEERARAGARAAILGAVSRECCAALSTLGKMPNVRQRVWRDAARRLNDERHHARFILKSASWYVPTRAAT